MMLKAKWTFLSVFKVFGYALPSFSTRLYNFSLIVSFTRYCRRNNERPIVSRNLRKYNPTERRTTHAYGGKQ